MNEVENTIASYRILEEKAFVLAKRKLEQKLITGIKTGIFSADELSRLKWAQIDALSFSDNQVIVVMLGHFIEISCEEISNLTLT